MYIFIKTDVFLSVINVNLHLTQQLMTVTSLHLHAIQCCILACCPAASEKALALNIWNVVA